MLEKSNYFQWKHFNGLSIQHRLLISEYTLCVHMEPKLFLRNASSYGFFTCLGCHLECNLVLDCFPGLNPPIFRNIVPRIYTLVSSSKTHIELSLLSTITQETLSYLPLISTLCLIALWIWTLLLMSLGFNFFIWK